MARYGIFGRSGSGKSWFFGYLLERLVERFDYAVHFDPDDEEQGLSIDGNALFKTFYVDAEFAQSEVEYDDRQMGLVEAVILENKKVRIVPDGLTSDELVDLFGRVSKLAMEIGKTDANFHLSGDEAHNLVPAVGDDLDERIERMLTGGRKKGVEWALCTQRPAKLHGDAYTQMNYGIYLSLTKDEDIAKVNGSTNFNAYEYLKELKPREYIIEDLDSGETKQYTTDEHERQHPHLAPDDGEADVVLDEVAEEGESLMETAE